MTTPLFWETTTIDVVHLPASHFSITKGIIVCRGIYLKVVETCYYLLFFYPCRMIEEKHRGHDLMHAEMFLILFGSIMVAQILLFLWRQKHSRSYQVEYSSIMNVV